MVRTSVPASRRWTANAWRSNGGDRLGNPAASVGFPTRAVHGPLRDRFPRAIAGKEPGPGSAHPPPVAQDRQQSRGQHHVAIFPALALLDAEDHPLAINDGNREPHGFGDP